MLVANTPEQINAVGLLGIKFRLKVELAGMKFKGGSTFAAVKKRFGFKGNKQKIYDQFVEYLRKEGILV